MSCPVCDEEMLVIDDCNENGDQVWQCSNDNCGEVEYR